MRGWGTLESMLARPLLALVAAAVLGSVADAQCDIRDEDFDAFAPGTPIDQLQGWSDQSPGNSVFLGADPDGGDTAIVFPNGVTSARRRIDLLGLGARFRISSTVTVHGGGSFRIVCPPDFQNGNFQLNFRANIVFDASSGVVEYRFQDGSPAATLPLVVGTPVRLEIDCDTAGDVVAYYDGRLLAAEAWNAAPFACPVPDMAAWQSAPGPAPMVVDDVCIGTPFGTPYCTAVPNSTGAPSIIEALGTPSFGANDCRLHVRRLPTSVFGLMVASRQTGFFPGAGGSTGNLCLGGSLGRDQIVLGSGPGGETTRALDWAAVPQASGPGPAQPGDTWHFQLWHRDLMGGVPTSNFSPGLTLTVQP